MDWKACGARHAKKIIAVKQLGMVMVRRGWCDATHFDVAPFDVTCICCCQALAGCHCGAPLDFQRIRS